MYIKTTMYYLMKKRKNKCYYKPHIFEKSLDNHIEISESLKIKKISSSIKSHKKSFIHIDAKKSVISFIPIISCNKWHGNDVGVFIISTPNPIRVDL